MAAYTRNELENMNAKAMKKMAFNDLGLVGLSKLTKDEAITAIINYQSSKKKTSVAPVKAATAAPLGGLQGSFTSILSKPGAQFGNRNTTTIQVSSGAATGNFDVVGRKVSDVAEFLREVLNVDRMANAVVNGKEVTGDYVIKSKDIVEFLKPAGKKGC